VKFPDDGVYTVAVRVRAAGGPTATAVATVTVANSAPSLTEVAATESGGVVSARARVTDAGDDDHMATIDWSDGGAPEQIPLSRAGGDDLIVAGHSFAGGIVPATVRINVTDDDGGSAVAEASVVTAPPNQPPTVRDQAATTRQGEAVTVSVATSDPDDALVTYEIAAPPAHGSATLVSSGPSVAALGAEIRYIPESTFTGSDSFVMRVDDSRGASATATVTITVLPDNHPPECSAVYPDRAVLWPPNGQFVTVTLGGATDPDGDPVTVRVTSVTADEPVGRTSPDAQVTANSARVRLRAERDATGDGRVYSVTFEVLDGKGATCTGVATVAVPHDQRRRAN
jgi:hypothetical protein